MRGYTEVEVIELLRQQRVDCANTYGAAVEIHDLGNPSMDIMRAINRTPAPELHTCRCEDGDCTCR